MADTLRAQLSKIKEEANINNAMIRLDEVKRKMRHSSWEQMDKLMEEEESINGYINRCIVRKGF